MPFLQPRDEEAVRKEFERIGGPVRLTVFATELGGEQNTQTVALVREVAALSDQLSVTVLNPHIDREQATAYGIHPSLQHARSYDHGAFWSAGGLAAARQSVVLPGRNLRL